MENRNACAETVGSQNKRSPLTLVSVCLVTIALGLATASTASALTLGLGWSGDYGGTAAEMDVIQRSGATLVRVPIDISGTNGGANWGTYDSIFTNAWENGITILPYLVRSNSQGTRFLTSADPGWAAWFTWTKAAVRRYGHNGSFWVGKANPRPVTTWEIWNEPNLVGNNPLISKSACQAIGQTFYEKHNTCVQPENYGAFLIYTAAAVQEGQQEQSGGGTGVLFGGLAFPYGDPYTNFLAKAYTVSGVHSSYHGLSIHPYGFDFGHANGDKTIAEVQNYITGVRSFLNSLPWGPSRSIWITELGWPRDDFGDKNFPQVKDEAEQARLLTESINWIKGEAASKGIQALLWYNARDLNIPKWDYRCGLRDHDGNYLPSWWAYQEQTGAPTWPLPPAPEPMVVAVVTPTGKMYAKVDDLFAAWVDESIPGIKITDVSVASDPKNGPILAVRGDNNHVYVKQGLHGEWVDQTSNAQAVAVGSDPLRGPIIAVVTNDGRVMVKEGSLHGAWVEQTAGAQAVTVDNDSVNGPIIGVRLTDGRIVVKEGSLHGTWVEQISSAQSVRVATDFDRGPIIAVVTNDGRVMVKEGSLHGAWVEQTAGAQAVTVDNDSVNGPIIGVRLTDGRIVVKEGSLHGTWVEQISSAQSVRVATDFDRGPIVAVLTNDGHAMLKEGSLYGTWVDVFGGVEVVAIAG